MWRIPPAPPGFFRLGKSLLSVEDTGAYFVSHERFCEAYYSYDRIERSFENMHDVDARKSLVTVGYARAHNHAALPGWPPAGRCQRGRLKFEG